MGSRCRSARWRVEILNDTVAREASTGSRPATCAQFRNTRPTCPPTLPVNVVTNNSAPRRDGTRSDHPSRSARFSRIRSRMLLFSRRSIGRQKSLSKDSFGFSRGTNDSFRGWEVLPMCYGTPAASSGVRPSGRNRLKELNVLVAREGLEPPTPGL